MLIQLTGLSGAGKTTLSRAVQPLLQEQDISTEVFDGDSYRKSLCSDLGFSRADREENILRLANLAWPHVLRGSVCIIAAINPFESTRNRLREYYSAKTVWASCPVSELARRDTKGLYQRALLADDHPQKIFNLSGVNDPYEPPSFTDLIIDTGRERVEHSVQKLYNFIYLLVQSRRT